MGLSRVRVGRVWREKYKIRSSFHHHPTSLAQHWTACFIQALTSTSIMFSSSDSPHVLERIDSRVQVSCQQSVCCSVSHTILTHTESSDGAIPSRLLLHFRKGLFMIFFVAGTSALGRPAGTISSLVRPQYERCKNDTVIA